MTRKRSLDKLSIYIPQSKTEQKPVERLIRLAEKKDRSMMKKALGLLLALLLLCFFLPYAYAKSAPSTISIAFFNALRFGNGGENCKGDLSSFAQILSRYDIIGLAEVMRNTATCNTYPQGELGHLDALEEALEAETDLSWRYDVSPEPRGRSTYKEYYVVFYNERVERCSRGCFLPDSTDEFEREPYYASFRAGNFDFTLMLFHAKPDAIVQEIPALKAAYAAVQAVDPYEDDVILMGDFNVQSRSDPLWSSLQSIHTMKRLINAPTTIGNNGLTSNCYDTIWIQSCYSGWEYTGDAGVYQFWEDLLPNLNSNEWHEYKGEVSDHLPIWARFRTDLDDDDGSGSVGIRVLSATPASAAQLVALEAQVKKLSNTIDDLKHDIEDLEDEVEELRDRVEELEEQVATLTD